MGCPSFLEAPFSALTPKNALYSTRRSRSRPYSILFHTGFQSFSLGAIYWSCMNTPTNHRKPRFRCQSLPCVPALPFYATSLFGVTLLLMAKIFSICASSMQKAGFAGFAGQTKNRKEHPCRFVIHGRHWIQTDDPLCGRQGGSFRYKNDNNSLSINKRDTGIQSI